MQQPGPSYLARLRAFTWPARLYLLHMALLTSSLAVSGLFFNLAIIALGYERTFLGLLNTLSLGVAAVLAIPLWWLAARIGPRYSLISATLLQALNALLFALWPERSILMLCSVLTGVAAVMFEVSAPPFMMRHSDATTRDHLFTTNKVVNLGFAGIATLLAGGLPALFAQWLSVDSESALAYRSTFLLSTVGLLISLVPLLLMREGARIESAPASEPETNTPTPTTTLAQVDGAWYLRFAWLSQLIQRLPRYWQHIVARPGPLLALMVPPLFISFGAALLIPYLNLFFKQTFEVADTLLGAMFATFNLSISFAALLSPLISVRIGKIRTILLTQALSIPFLILMGFVPVLAIAFCAALLRTALFNMGSPLYGAFAMERSDEMAHSTVIGLINGAYSVGYLIAPTVSTYTQEHYGFTPLFIASAICYILAVACNYWFFVRGGRDTGTYRLIGA
jgi:MFS family permease